MSSINHVDKRAERVPVEGVNLVREPFDRNTRLSAAKLLRRLDRACGYDGMREIGVVVVSRAS